MPIMFFSVSLTRFEIMKQRGKSTSLKGGRTQLGVIIHHGRRLLPNSATSLMETLLLDRIMLP